MGSVSIFARVEFQKRLMPKMLLIMPTVVVCTMAAGFQLARYQHRLGLHYPHSAWLIASYIIVGIMTLIALGLLEPANVTVLFELKKPQPNPEVVGALMKRFIYSAGLTGLMRVATLIIMTRLAIF